MKISLYTIFVDNFPEPEHYVAYNTRTQAMVRLEAPLKEFLDRIQQADTVELALRWKEIEQLQRMGILVEDVSEEKKRLEEHFRQIKYYYEPARLTVSLLTTYACNFKCTYCFEESSRVQESMNKETSDHALEWIQDRIKKMTHVGLRLNYYGGEPLLHPETIDYTALQMFRWCRAEQVRFEFSLQTNGYLMTPDIIERYKKIGLVHARVSLDGVGDVHDRRRPLRGGGATFERIIENIRHAVDQIGIEIAFGYTNDEVEPFEDLVRYLEKEGLLSKVSGFICTPVHPSVDAKGNPEATRGGDCSCNMDDAVMISAIQKLDDIFTRYNLRHPNRLSISACAFTRENSGVTIDQNGNLFRCNSLLGHSQYSFGNVRTRSFNSLQRSIRDIDAWKQCPTDCAYLPMCGGGCRLMSFLTTGDITKPACKRKYLDAMTPSMIKKEFQRSKAAQAASRKV